MANCPNQTTCTTVTEQIGYLFVTPVICLLGMCFNILILIIFSKSSFRTQMTSSLVTYLTGLTVVDLFNSLINWITIGVYSLHWCKINGYLVCIQCLWEVHMVIFWAHVHNKQCLDNITLNNTKIPISFQHRWWCNWP